jgi:hypothetical protein
VYCIRGGAYRHKTSEEGLEQAANTQPRRSVYKRCMYKQGILRFLPVDAFNNGQTLDLAKKLHVQLYEHFARLVLVSIWFRSKLILEKPKGNPLVQNLPPTPRP